MNDWLKKQQRKKIPYGFFKNALDSRKEVSLGVKDQGIFPIWGIQLRSPASPVLAGRFFTTSTTWEGEAEGWAEVLSGAGPSRPPLLQAAGWAQD